MDFWSTLLDGEHCTTIYFLQIDRYRPPKAWCFPALLGHNYFLIRAEVITTKFLSKSDMSEACSDHKPYLVVHHIPDKGLWTIYLGDFLMSLWISSAHTSHLRSSCNTEIQLVHKMKDVSILVVISNTRYFCWVGWYNYLYHQHHKSPMVA